MFLLDRIALVSLLFCFFPPRHNRIVKQKCCLLFFLNFHFSLLFFFVLDIITSIGPLGDFQDWIPVNERVSNNCFEHLAA